MPTASISADTDSGEVPLAVSFDGTGSTDDGSIAWYEWFTGDSATLCEPLYRDSLVDYTYNTVGNYKAELVVHDNHGNIDKDTMTIQVVPTDEDVWLSLWVHDTYRGDSTGRLKWVVLIDADTVWQQDIAGDSGWIHIAENINTEVGASDSVTLTIKVACLQSESNMLSFTQFWIDDVAVFWGTVLNPDFESGRDNWTFNSGGTGFYGSGYSWALSAETRSGNRAYCLRTGANVSANAWVQISQKIDIVD